MTELPVPRPRHPVSTDKRSPSPSGDVQCAATVLAQRALLVTRTRNVHGVPDYLRDARFGLGLCGAKADIRIAELVRRERMLLVSDPAVYERCEATADEPCVLPADFGDMLFGGGIDGLLDDQLARGATVAMAPTCHIRAEDSDALKAVMRAGQDLHRSDVLFPVSVDVSWLRDGPFTQLKAVLGRISHPKALILGGQYNPTDHYASVPRNLRLLYREVPDVGLWRTDPVTGFDCLAHGGLFAGIGGATSLRHLVPPGQKTQYGGGSQGPHLPSVFLPELLIFLRADTLGRLYANVAPPSCSCAACHGRPLDRFNGNEAEMRQAAEAHNLLTWTSILRQLLAYEDEGERQAWWRRRCQMALRARGEESDRIQQATAFPLSKFKTIKAIAELPLAHDAAPVPANR